MERGCFVSQQPTEGAKVAINTVNRFFGISEWSEVWYQAQATELAEIVTRSCGLYKSSAGVDHIPDYTSFAELQRALGNAREPLDPRTLTIARLRPRFCVASPLALPVCPNFGCGDRLKPQSLRRRQLRRQLASRGLYRPELQWRCRICRPCLLPDRPPTLSSSCKPS